MLSPFSLIIPLVKLLKIILKNFMILFMVFNITQCLLLISALSICKYQKIQHH